MQQKIIELIGQVRSYGIFRNELAFIKSLRRQTFDLCNDDFSYCLTLRRFFLGLILEEADQYHRVHDTMAKNWKPYYIEDQGVGKLFDSGQDLNEVIINDNKS